MNQRLPDGSPVRARYRIAALTHRQDILLMVWIGYVIGATYVVLFVLR